MINLPKSLDAWGSPDFEKILCNEVEEIDAGLFPFQQGLSRGSYVTSTKFKTMLIHIDDETKNLRVKLGIFYTAIIAGCSCADDPTPIDELAEYCEVELFIDKVSAEATINLLEE